MNDYVVLGGGGHARVLAHTLQRLGHRVLGYTAPVDEGLLRGTPWLGDDASLGRLAPGSRVVLGVGKIAIETPRLLLLERLQGQGMRFPVVRAATALVHDEVEIEAGSVVMDGAIVVTGSRLGRACIVNTHATVDHDCVLGDDVHVAPGATLSGGITVGDRCLIGTGASLIQGVTLCADCLIGAGATVTDDIVTPGTYVGTPARRIA